MKRVGLVAGLMVLVLGLGAVAQSPSPEASSLAAPDDSELTLPSTVGEYDLTLTEGNVAEVLAATPEQLSFWQEALSPFGKGPEEGQFVSGAAYTASGDIMAVGLFAIRVAGVPADALAEPFLSAFLGAAEDLGGAEGVPEFTLEWLEVDGRRIQALTGDEYPFPSYLYANGDVLYFVGIASDDLTIEDVLAALP